MLNRRKSFKFEVVFCCIDMNSMYGNGMKQLEERHVPTKVLKMKWSNKMDLLAIAKEHGKQKYTLIIWRLRKYQIFS